MARCQFCSWAFHASLQVCDAPPIAVAGERSHLCLQHAKIAQHLGLELIHHAHGYDPIGRFRINAAENSEYSVLTVPSLM